METSAPVTSRHPLPVINARVLHLTGPEGGHETKFNKALVESLIITPMASPHVLIPALNEYPILTTLVGIHKVVLKSDSFHGLQVVDADEVFLYLDSPFYALREIRAKRLHLMIRGEISSVFKQMFVLGVPVWMGLPAVCKHVLNIISHGPAVYFGEVPVCSVTSVIAPSVIWESDTKLPRLLGTGIGSLYKDPGSGPFVLNSGILYLLRPGQHSGVREIRCSAIVGDLTVQHSFPDLLVIFLSRPEILIPITAVFPVVVYRENELSTWIYPRWFTAAQDWHVQFLKSAELDPLIPFLVDECESWLHYRGTAPPETRCRIKELVGGTFKKIELLANIQKHLYPDPWIRGGKLKSGKIRVVSRYMGVSLQTVLDRLDTSEAFLWVYTRLIALLVACDMENCTLHTPGIWNNYAVTPSSAIVPVDEHMPYENVDDHRRELALGTQLLAYRSDLIDYINARGLVRAANSFDRVSDTLLHQVGGWFALIRGRMEWKPRWDY